MPRELSADEVNATLLAAGFKNRSKCVRIRVTIAEPLPGQSGEVIWLAWTENATVLGDGKPHRVRGWMLLTHDGCERFTEGNWQALVHRVTTETAPNYGATARIS